MPPVPAVSQPIGPSGGHLATWDGLIWIDVPAGAVQDDVILTLTGQPVELPRQSYTYYEFSLSAARVLDGSALQSFNAPATYTLRFPTDPGPQADTFSLLWFNSQGSYWYSNGGIVDLSGTLLQSSSDKLGVFELAADPLLTSGPNEQVVYPIEGGVLTDKTGEVQVTFSGGDTTERLRLRVTPVEPCRQHPAERHIITEFRLDAEAIDRGSAAVTMFAAAVELKITHTLDELIAFAPDSPKIYWFNEGANKWEAVDSNTVPGTGVITAGINHFSTFSTQGDTDILRPPDNQYFQVDMHSGASTASIPLNLPPAPGGLGPQLSLNYSSSAVDEMKSKTSMASWVGTGWSLGVPSISRDPFARPLDDTTPAADTLKGRYFLSMNGLSDLLIRENAPIAGTSDWFKFHTKRETYLDIKGRACNISDPYGNVDSYYEFFVRTKDGTEYQFGTKIGAPSCANADAGAANAPSSLQYFTRYWANPAGWHRYHYRMDVSRITDTKGNIIDFQYWQEVRQDCFVTPCKPYVRAAYPGAIVWGANLVTFNRFDFDGSDSSIGGWDEDFGGVVGRVRFDAPIDTQSPVCAQPHVMDTRALTRIEVKAFGSVVREYDLGYVNDGTRVRNQNAGPDNCPAAGVLKLQSFSQKGTGPSVLRTMTFGYANSTVEFKDSSGGNCPSPHDYSPWRAYLSSATNGFGGSVSHGYQEKWKSDPNRCTWTHNAVVTRTLSPGGSQPPMSYTYEYPPPSGPVDWFVNGMKPEDAEFRGFSQVKETNATGSVTCYFLTAGYVVGLTDHCDYYDTAANSNLKTTYDRYTITDSCTSACDQWEPPSQNSEFEVSKFVAVDSSDETVVGRSRSIVQYTYGEYGNVKDICEFSTDVITVDCKDPTATPQWYRRTTTSYAPNPGLYIVGLPTETWVTGASGTKISDTAFFYDYRDPDSTNPNEAPLQGLLTGTRLLSDAGWMTTNRYAYDAFGNRTSDTTYRSAGTAGSTQTTDYTACGNTQPASVTNAAGHVTTYSYNETSNNFGCIIGRPEEATDPNGVPHNIRYDEFGRKTKEWAFGDSDTQPTIHYYYSDLAAGAPFATFVWQREQSGTNNELWHVDWFDGLGRLLQKREERSDLVTTVVDIGYDSAGNKAWETIPYDSTAVGGNYSAPVAGVAKTSYQYDYLGRVTDVTNPDGGVHHTTYDGVVVTEVDENGHKTEHTQDSLGRTIQVREYSGGGIVPYTLYSTTSYSYDERDRLVGVVAPPPAANPSESNTTTIVYDKAGWKKSMTDPDSGLWSYTNYSDGLLKTQTDPRGVTTTMSYDPLGRIVVKGYDGFTPDPPNVTYIYDGSPSSVGPKGALMPAGYPKGRLTMVSNAVVEQLYSYDARGRTTDERVIINGADDVKHTYDSMDREVSTTYPDGEVVSRSFDAQGLVQSVRGADAAGSLGTYLNRAEYNAAGSPTRWLLGSGLDVRYGYRPNDLRLQSICATSLGQPCTPCPSTSTNELLKVCYQSYDGRGNITSIFDPLDKTGGSSGTTSTYSYDHRDRLTGVSGLAQSLSYSYDPIGNLTSKQGESGNSYTLMDYGYGDAGPHAITTACCALSQHTFQYDAMGNMTWERVEPTWRHNFAYDAEGRLSMRASAGEDTVSYTYDAGGSLVKKSSATGGDTVYVGGIYEKNVTSGEVTKYYYAGGQRVAMRKAGTVYFLTQDHLGGTALVTQAGSPTKMVSRVRYYPYGTIRTQEFGPGVTELPTDKLYTGQQRETEGGIYYYGARFYNADIGRFLSADSIVPGAGDPQALNRYAYALNNPLRYSDPTGHCPAGDDGHCDWSLTGGTPVCYSCGGHRRIFIPFYPVLEFDPSMIPLPVGGEGALRAAQTAWLLGAAGAAGCAQYCGDALRGGANGIEALGDFSSAFGTMFSGGAAPVRKGQEGVERAVDELEDLGFDVVGREITVDTSEGRTRIDVVVEDDEGNLGFIEVKHGPAALTTSAQRDKLSALNAEGGTVAGHNAIEAGFEQGERITGEVIVIYIWD